MSEQTYSEIPLERIVEFCRQEDVPRAFWVTRREQDFGLVQFSGLATQFLRVPAHVFTYLLGQAEQEPGVR